MIKSGNFRELEIYHLAHKFVLDIYELAKDFPKSEDNNLTSQLVRAATCLPLNIAEGSGANSNKVFLNFLVFCYRSSLEVEACLRLGKDLGYINNNKFDIYFEKLDKFVRKLYRYMQYLDEITGNRKNDRTQFYRQYKYYADQSFQQRKSNSRPAY